MSSTVSWDAMCRLCLSSHSRLLPIFGREESDALACKIRDCVAVQVKEDDQLPTSLCSKCLGNVNNWCQFKKICEKSQKKLETLSKEKIENLINIKSEPLSDETYDDGVVIDGAYLEYDQNNIGKIQPEGPPILASLGLAPRNDKNIVDPRTDWHRVEAILNLVQEDDVIDALQSAEEIDNIQYSDHDSDSEADLVSNVDECYLENDKGYVSKDHHIFTRIPKKNKDKKNLPLKRFLPTSKPYVPRAKDAWRTFFTKEMLDYIVECTNDHIATHSSLEKLTKVAELEAVIGVLYLHGVARSFHSGRSDLWMPGLRVESVVKAISQERFNFVLQNLKFEKQALINHSENDVLKPIRTICELFALNCRISYEVGSYVVVDEKIEVIFGPCSFRTNFVNKPLHCGIKVITLVDPTCFYVSNLDVITDIGRATPDECVNKLVHHLTGTGRTVVMDSWFTSLSLVRSLLDEHGLYSVAALKPSDNLVPPFFVSQHRSNQTFMTAFIDEDVALTSFVTAQRKVICTLSSHPRFYKRSGIYSESPVAKYKQYQSAGEVLDVLTKYYTTSQHTNSWTLSLFFSLLDMASINAQVLYLSCRGETIVRRNTFLRMLALGLLEEHQSDKQEDSTPIVKRQRFLPTWGVDSMRSRTSRCRLCPRLKNRKTRTRCFNCQIPMCREHALNLCQNCASLCEQNC